jgi:CheY-like chemotaxis protein
MITNDAVDSTVASHPDPDTDAGWHVVIAYDDVPAGRRAMHTLDNVGHAAGGTLKLCPLLWRFDILEDPGWRTEATIDTQRANLLIISTSSKGDLPAAVKEWVRSCLSQKQGHTAVVVALLGPADDTDVPDSPRVQFLRNAAEAAGLGFFAPTPHAARPPPAEALSRGPARPAHRILLVEDDNAVRQASAMFLVRAGYQVNAVEGSQAAWEALQSLSYDLLITDNQMPEMSGLELVRKLRSAQLALPVIMASGGIDERDLTQNQWLQPAKVLPKPFTSAALLETVAEVLPLAARVPFRPELSFPGPVDSYNHWGLNE